MRIVIIGGGQVGTELSSRLSQDHDVVIIERNNKLADILENQLDAMIVQGNGASSSILETAGIKQTDMLIAVTEIDEVNIIACMLAKKYGVAKTVARIRNPEYDQDGSILTSHQLGIDHVINPEAVAAIEIKKYIDFPGINDVEYYAEGTIKMIGLNVKETDPIVDTPLQEIDLSENSIICCIVRGNGEVIVPGGKDIIRSGDEIYILGKKGSLDFHKVFNREKKKNYKIVIAGGGRVGFKLAELIESSSPLKTRITLIEKDLERCKKLAEELTRTNIVNGDVTNCNFLRSIELEKTDIFVAATGDDEVNLLSTLLAKEMGTLQTISEVIRSDYNIILNSIGINKIVSPRLLTAAQIMRIILKGNVINLTILKEEKAEIIELILAENAHCSGKMLKDAGLPKGVLVGAISRDNNTFIPGGNDYLLSGDRIVVFTLHDLISKVENLFSAPSKSLKNIFSFR